MSMRLPATLPRSASIDVEMLLRGHKPAARIWAGEARGEVRRWARRMGLFSSSDPEGYVVLSRSGSDARRILSVDRRPGRHTSALGKMLGYPNCCSRKAARVGDEGIDGLQASLALRRFRGRFVLTDPRGHRAGLALLSHVPCSHVCSASLAIARRSSTC